MSNSAAVAVIKAAVYREGGSEFDYSALTVEARGDARAVAIVEADENYLARERLTAH